MTAAPTRRSALGIIATGPIAMLPALAVMQCSQRAEASPTSALTSLIERYRSMDERHDRWHAEVYEPKREARLAQMQAAIDAVPHHTTEASFENMEGETRHWSTAQSHVVAIARRILKEPIADEGYMRQCRELADAADKRDARISEIRERFRDDPMIHADQRYSAAIMAAFDAVVAYEPRTLAELATKAVFYSEEEVWDHLGASFADDVKRLAGEA